MAATVRVILYQGLTPTFKLSTRAAPDTLLATIYTGVVVSGRPSVYAFATAVADGEYAITQLEYPYAVGVVSIAGTTAEVYGTFEEMDAAEGGGGGGSVTVLPAYVTQQKAKQLNELFISIGSLSTVSLTCFDTAGSPLDLSGRTLSFLVSEEDSEEVSGQSPVDEIVNADLTVSGDDGNLLTFTYTETIVASPRRLLWSLRDVSDSLDDELIKGVINVSVSGWR
jgi:hypothetical protein